MRNIYDKVGHLGLYALLEGSDRANYGNTWFVDENSGGTANNANAGQGASWAAAFTTLNYAISRCSNDAGDVIFVAADHTEDFSTKETTSGTTTTGAVVDKSGVTIIGLGTQDRRPTFSTTAAAGVLNVTASECTLCNLLFKSNYADTVALINADSGADGLLVEDCEFRDNSAITEYKLGISIAANCNDTIIRGCRFLSTDTASATEAAIRYVGAHYRSTIQDCVFRGDWGGGSTDACIDASTTASFDFLVDNNIINNMDPTYGSAIEVHASTTGAITNNVIYCTGAAAAPLAAAGCIKSGNTITTALAASAEGGGSSAIMANYYVDSGSGTAGNAGTSWAEAEATLDAAIALCADNNGDTIHVAPGHAEDYVAAGANLTLDKIGVHIIGYGTGTNRPTFTFKTEVSADIEVDAANCTIENCIFINDITGLDAPFDVDAAGFTLKNCLTRDLGTDICDNWIFADGGADYLTIIGHKHEGTASANGVTWLAMSAACDFLTVKDCVVDGNFSAACIDFAAAVGSVMIDNCTLINANAVDVCFECFAASTGVMRNCSLSILTDGQTTAIHTAGAMSYFENYYTDNPVSQTAIICAAEGITGA